MLVKNSESGNFHFEIPPEVKPNPYEIKRESNFGILWTLFSVLFFFGLIINIIK